MTGSYEEWGHVDKAVLRDLLARESREQLLPLVNVVALVGGALDHIIDVTAPTAVEAVLEISAGEVAGEMQPGCKCGGRREGV